MARPLPPLGERAAYAGDPFRLSPRHRWHRWHPAAMGKGTALCSRAIVPGRPGTQWAVQEPTRALCARCFT